MWLKQNYLELVPVAPLVPPPPKKINNKKEFPIRFMLRITVSLIQANSMSQSIQTKPNCSVYGCVCPVNLDCVDSADLGLVPYLCAY